MNTFTDSNPPYPRFYMYRGRRGSAKEFILKRMAVLPEAIRCEVAREYEAIFQAQANRSIGNWFANEYLDELAASHSEKAKLAREKRIETATYKAAKEKMEVLASDQRAA